MTVPDTVYRQIAGMAARRQVRVERIVAAALAGQMAARGSREIFLAALDKAPAAEPAPGATAVGVRVGYSPPGFAAGEPTTALFLVRALPLQ